MENSTETHVEETKDEKILKLHRKVEKLKKSRRLEESYMTLEELVKDLAEERAKELVEERMAAGSQLTLSFVSLMIWNNLVEEIPRLSENADFNEPMLKKYHLK